MVAKRVAAVFPKMAIVMLATLVDENDVRAAAQAGARGYIVKGLRGKSLIEIVRAVDRGARCFPRVDASPSHGWETGTLAS